VDVRRPKTDDISETTDHIHHLTQLLVNEDVRQIGLLDRKSIENGTDDRKRRSQVNAMNFYLGCESPRSGNVVKPEVTSDGKQYVKEVGVAEPEPAIGSVQVLVSMPYDQHEQQGGPGAEGELTTTKLLERRRAGGRGRMTHEQQLRIMIDQLKTKQSTDLHQYNNDDNVCGEVGQVATPGESNNTQTPSRRGHETTQHSADVVCSKIHRQSSDESCSSPSISSQPSSPTRFVNTANVSSNTNHPGHVRSQDVPPAWTHQNVSPTVHQLCPRLVSDDWQRADAATRRQIEYEAGLRRYGPNYEPQTSIDDDDNDHHAVSNGTCLTVQQTYIYSLSVCLIISSHLVSLTADECIVLCRNEVCSLATLLKLLQLSSSNFHNKRAMA